MQTNEWRSVHSILYVGVTSDSRIVNTVSEVICLFIQISHSFWFLLPLMFKSIKKMFQQSRIIIKNTEKEGSFYTRASFLLSQRKFSEGFKLYLSVNMGKPHRKQTRRLIILKHAGIYACMALKSCLNFVAWSMQADGKTFSLNPGLCAGVVSFLCFCVKQ